MSTFVSVTITVSIKMAIAVSISVLVTMGMSTFVSVTITASTFGMDSVTMTSSIRPATSFGTPAALSTGIIVGAVILESRSLCTCISGTFFPCFGVGVSATIGSLVSISFAGSASITVALVVSFPAVLALVPVVIVGGLGGLQWINSSSFSAVAARTLDLSVGNLCCADNLDGTFVGTIALNDSAF